MIPLIITLLFSAFFSGMEIAFVASNKMIAQINQQKTGITQKCLKQFYQHPDNFISTMLVGNNIALVIYGIIFAYLTDQLLTQHFSADSINPAIKLAIDTIVSTLIVLFTAEFLPKNIFKNNPHKFLNTLAIPAYITYVVLYPIAKTTTNIANAILRLTGLKSSDKQQQHIFTKDDLDNLIQNTIITTDNEPSAYVSQSSQKSQPSQSSQNTQLIKNTLQLHEKKGRDCMIPRTEINALPDNATPQQLKQKFIETGNSKIIIYQQDIDHIIGYIHAAQLFNTKETSDKLPSIIPIPIVPETIALHKLMHTLLQEKKSIAAIIDEFGGTAGIVTLEDIIEEILGEIEDEHDNKQLVAKQTDPDTYIISARLEINKINNMLNINLPEDDEYNTLAGLILHYHQNFPKINQTIQIHDFQCKVIKKTNTKIQLVELKLNQPQPPEDSNE